MSTIKVDTLNTRTGSGNITFSRPITGLSGSGASLTALNATEITSGTLPIARIADDAVTLAKMAGLVRGKIIVGDASGNPSALTVGSNGQALVSDGTDISWGSAGASTFNALSDATISTSDPATNTNPSATGHIWVNKTSGETYVCTDATSNGNIWTNVGGGSGNIAPFVVATGGTVTTSGNYKMHTFTGDGTFTVTQSGPGTVESLVIAGGGGGGGGQRSDEAAGGGGAGGYRNSYGSETSGGGGSSESALSISEQAYSITVGAGGAAGPLDTSGSVGANSIFSTITSQGGGYGAKYNAAGGPGGSGGGGGETGQAGGLPTTVQGYVGGAGGSGGQGRGTGGGGGGASAAGQQGNNSTNTGGNGGAGLSSSITGSAVTRAGGGGGSSNGGQGSPVGGEGGSGGGGDGSNNTSVAGGTGTANTGSGGGGGTAGSNPAGSTGGAGGSGIVIIRYQYQ